MNSLIHYGSKKVINLILFGTLGVAIVLTSLLISYDIWIVKELRIRTLVGVSVIIYLTISKFLLYKNKIHAVSWMLIILYSALSFTTLLYWGLHSAVGIFATSFIIIMSGFLLGSRSLLYVTIGVIMLLIIVQSFHLLEIVKPDLRAMSEESNFLDVISYATILGIFSLITWISSNQMEKTLQRAKDAEKSIRAQKDFLATELEKESTRLREIKLKEVRQLYKFATFGQTTAATLHELSNHLTILNMDIGDLKQQNINSKAIKNAEESIEQINKMVRQARRQLNSYDNTETFNALKTIDRSIQDSQEKFHLYNVELSKSYLIKGVFNIKGNPLALMQILSILLNNALDACYNIPNPQVLVRVERKKDSLFIYVKDNGIGIDPENRNMLFSPIASKKPTGLGVGLYIAHELTNTHFNGTLRALNSEIGAEFLIKIPKNKN